MFASCPLNLSNNGITRPLLHCKTVVAQFIPKAAYVWVAWIRGCMPTVEQPKGWYTLLGLNATNHDVWQLGESEERGLV